MPRLDRYLSATTGLNHRELRLLLARGLVTVDGSPATQMAQLVNAFSQIVCDGTALASRTRRYLMLNKPRGVVSATRDKTHSTVIDLLDLPYKEELHIVGRLDFNSTGLVLLTNDGSWSRRLSNPQTQIQKRYRVRVEQPISDGCIEAFAGGMYFGYENITTLPAALVLHSDFEADVGLLEGRYHQIKRMFGRFDNKVLDIHRYAVGAVTLDESLAPGAYRELEAGEIVSL